MVGFWVEGPNDEDAGEIDASENVECLFITTTEDGWEGRNLALV